MPLRPDSIRLAVLTGAALIAAYLSITYIGGLLVFGFRSPMEFAIFFVPVMAFPVALLACWRARVGLVLWATLMLLFFGAQVLLAWPAVTDVAQNNDHFLLFLSVALLLLWAVISESKRQTPLVPATESNPPQVDKPC